MEKRKVNFGIYDTGEKDWTLNICRLDMPQQQTNYVDVFGRRKGPLDLSTAMTDGEPIYGSRLLTVRLEGSFGNKSEREDEINTMINRLDGYTMNIRLPDDAEHYLVGAVHVVKEYNDLAHAAVMITATCEPWRYNNQETAVAFTALQAEQTVSLTNAGRLTVEPLLTVYTGEIKLSIGGVSRALSAGTYKLPETVLSHGSIDVTYSGTGAAKFTYREGVL